jgi:PAS domain S-box-containing protein
MDADLEGQLAAVRQELAELRDREQDLRDFLDNASLALHAVGPDGVILWANQAELDLLGYTADEYIGRHVHEFHADEPVIADILRRLKNRETLRNYEARLRRKDGSIRHVLISSNVRWRGQEFLHTRCFTRDITDRKRYEQRLVLQYEIARVLIDASALEDAAPAVLELIATHLDCCAALLWTSDGTALQCRASWESAEPGARGIGCISREYAFGPGSGLPGRVWTSKAPAWVSDLRQDTNFPRLRLVSDFGVRSGFGFPIALEDDVLGVMEFFADEVRAPDPELLQLTATLGRQLGEFVARTNALRRVAESEESYRVLTETATDGVISIDEDSTIQLVNSAAAKIFGYTADELRGSDLTRLIPDYLAARATYVEAGRRRNSWQSVGVTGEHRDGHEIPLEVSFGEYRQGSRRFFVSVLRDITERKRLEDQLRQSAKLESLGVLAGGIAHDFNNLLTGILGNISLAMELIADGDAESATGILQNGVEASERAAHLTKQLLAYAGKGRFVVEFTDVSVLIRDLSALVKTSIPKHVRLRLELQEPLPPVEADIAQMQQLMMNLIINAAEAIPEGEQGLVRVATSAHQLTGEYPQHDFGGDELEPGLYIAIEIQDNGSGMDEATLQRIFDPFFTTKFTGRGLGLAAALGIVRGHKGALKVLSAPRQGTTFKILLPAVIAAPPKVENRAGKSYAGGCGTILVVDDESIVRETASASLERHGYQVITAEDGKDGVERFAESHRFLSMVILDATMPVMSGHEALRRMHAIDSSVPVVLSSGFNEEEAVRRFTGQGLAGFIQKPYTAAALVEKVRAVADAVKAPK